MVFLKTRPFVRRNTEFTNVSSFTLLLMCSTHLTLSCRLLPFSLPTTNNFFKFVYSEITGESAWRVLFRSALVLFASLASEGHQNWTHYDSGLLISRTFLPHAGSSCTLFFFLFSVLYTKNVLKRAQFSRCSTTFFDHFTFFLRTEKSEVLVCPVYTPYEFIVLANSIRLLYFHICIPVFLPFVYNCCVIRTSLVPHLHHYITIPPER